MALKTGFLAFSAFSAFSRPATLGNKASDDNDGDYTDDDNTMTVTMTTRVTGTTCSGSFI